ncbi:MAG: SusC/RagA family TonB-linked outer membrane protein, partial [Tannerellaceae bacterium]|nr:SusC/RagA family TonB-linked outer membrane protein [Tannerellaceae bacterium]
MRKKKLIFSLVTLLICFIPALAQDISIKGTVVSKTDGEPVIGASIIQTGTTNGTITDFDGNFILNVPANAELTISYIGFSTLKVTAQPTLFIELSEDTQLIDEVVVTGYSSQKKADLTGAVAVVKMDEIKTLNNSNAIQSLQGRVPGIHVTNTGQPDGDVDVKIRGVSTLGNSKPLYIIDGIPSTRSMNEIAPSDIESIQILKDASAASIYGSRAANGVIIITTKKAKAGGTNVEFRSNLTVQQWQRSLSLLDTQQLGMATWYAAINDGDLSQPGKNISYGNFIYDWGYNSAGHPVMNSLSTPEYLYVGGEPVMRTANTDWIKEVSRVGFTQNYNATVTTGTEKGRALFSMDYYGNNGTVKGTYFNRITARINSDYKLFNDRVTIGENLSISKTRSSILNAGDLQEGARNIQPLVPVYAIDGSWGGPSNNMSDRQNPVRLIEDNKQNHQDIVRLFGDIFVDIEILKNLVFRSKLGLDYTGYWKRNMQRSYTSGYLSDATAYLDTEANYGGNWILSNTLNYKFDLGKHKFDILAGQEMLKYSLENMSAGRDGFLLETADYMYLDAGETNIRNSGNGTSY